MVLIQSACSYQGSICSLFANINPLHINYEYYANSMWLLASVLVVVFVGVVDFYCYSYISSAVASVTFKQKFFDLKLFLLYMCSCFVNSSHPSDKRPARNMQRR